jgi:putative ABC transport system permease protein
MNRNLRIALRTLWRQRAFSITAIATLALGVGATTAIFSVVHGILLKPLPYVEPERLVHLGQTARSAPASPVDGSSSHLNFLDWQRASRTIAPMAMYSAGRAVVTDRDGADVVRVGTVTSEFFSVFKVSPLQGRGFEGDNHLAGGPRAVVVSYGYWQDRLGGRDDVVGQTIEIGGVPWPIVGVMPRGFDYPNGARLWLPLRADDSQCGRGCVYLNAIGRLVDGATPEAAKDEMTAVAAALEREHPDNSDVTVMVETLEDRTVGSVRQGLVILLAAVALVLLIACANVANLVLVRGLARQNEIAVRTALGARRREIMAYLLTENLVLAFVGGAFGLVLAIWGVDMLRALAPLNLPRADEVRFDAVTFAFAVAVALLTTMLFGLAPSLQLSKRPVVRSLGQRGTLGAGQTRWARSALLVAEVGLSLTLLLGAGLLLRSLSSLQHIELGFVPDHLTVFTVSLPPARYPADRVVSTHEELDARLAAIPGVSSVARISGLPLGPSENVLSFRRLDQPPPPPGQAPNALYRVVDPDYFPTMQVAVVRGRGFETGDRDGAQGAVVISERMAEMFWPGEDPLGRPLGISGRGPGVVVGVVANVRSQTLAAVAQPEMYVPHAQAQSRAMTFVVQSTQDSAQVLAAARQVVRRYDARLPLIGPSAMQALLDEQLARPRFYLMLLALFAVLAVSLAAVGLYGVVAYVVTQRTREIGVRMALGAARGEVVALMLWQGLRPAIAGMAAGAGLAYLGGRALSGLLHEVQPHDPATFAVVVAMLFVVVIIACAIPARRASGVAPADALRGE